MKLLSIKKKSDIKVLVLTACCDEDQLEAQKQSVHEQRGVTIDHQIVKDMSFSESQKAIYELAYRSKDEFDYCLKLDGDMLLGGPTVIKSVVKKLSISYPRYVRLMFPVNDYFVQGQIFGCHLWLSSYTPENFEIRPPRGDAWIDSMPAKVVKKTSSPLVYHGFSPSLPQALRFGMNRGLKALSFGPFSWYWRSLIALENAYARSGFEIRKGTALLGAAVVLKGIETKVAGSHLEDDLENKAELLNFVREQELLGHPILQNRRTRLIRRWYLMRYPNADIGFKFHQTRIFLKEKWMGMRWPDL